MSRLSQHIHDLQEGKSSVDNTAANRQRMLDLAGKYGTFADAENHSRPLEPSSRAVGKTIVSISPFSRFYACLQP